MNFFKRILEKELMNFKIRLRNMQELVFLKMKINFNMKIYQKLYNQAQKMKIIQIMMISKKIKIWNVMKKYKI